MRFIAHLCSASVLWCCTACVPPASNTNDNNDNGNSNDDADLVQLGVDIQIPDEGASHLPTGTQITYVANPPASGSHWPSPASRGFYTTTLDEERWVHSLEHGYVVVLYDCDGPCPTELLDQLQNLVDTVPVSADFGYSKIIAVPYAGLREPAVLTAIAWDVQMHLAGFDEAKLLDFFNRYQDQGPEHAP